MAIKDRKNVTGRPLSLSGGQMLAPRGVARVEDDPEKNAHDAALVADGSLIEVPDRKPPSKKDLQDRAEALGVEGFKSMNVEQLTEEIAKAEAKPPAENGGTDDAS